MSSPRQAAAIRVLLAGALVGLACATPPREAPSAPEDSAPTSSVRRADGDSYIELAAIRDGYGDSHLMHWPVRKMPIASFSARSISWSDHSGTTGIGGGSFSVESPARPNRLC